MLPMLQPTRFSQFSYSGGSSDTLRNTPPYIHRPGAPEVYARSNSAYEY